MGKLANEHLDDRRILRTDRKEAVRTGIAIGTQPGNGLHERGVVVGDLQECVVRALITSGPPPSSAAARTARMRATTGVHGDHSRRSQGQGPVPNGADREVD